MNKQLNIRFECIDFWGRVIYKVENKKVYLTNTEILFPNKEISPNGKVKEINNFFKDNIDSLVIHGSNIDDDPLGSKVGKGWELNIIN